MRIIAVIDLLGGRAVHARAGDRLAYQPVTVVGGVPVPPGDAATIAHAYLTRLGIADLYVADLDAILGHPPHDAIVMTLATISSSLWLDSGVSSVERAERAIASGASNVVVGLETLGSYAVLRDICRDVDGARVAFSLDLKGGVPVSPYLPHEPPDVLAARAAEAGVGTILLIDLARVGGRSGLDMPLVAQVRKAASGVALVAGGGVRGTDDLRQLADAGCDGALVATALHEGRITAADIAAVA